MIRELFLRIVGVALVAVSSLGLVSCGGGGHHHDEGTLEVFNSDLSFEVVESVDIEEIGGPDDFFFDVFLDPGESFFVDLFPGTYDVTVFWSDDTFEIHTVDVFDDFVTTLTVEN
jgi:hypothetical protein